MGAAGLTCAPSRRRGRLAGVGCSPPTSAPPHRRPSLSPQVTLPSASSAVFVSSITTLARNFPFFEDFIKAYTSAALQTPAYPSPSSKAVMASQATPTSPDTPITIKLALDGSNRRFKLPLRDLGIAVFATKVCFFPFVPS